MSAAIRKSRHAQRQIYCTTWCNFGHFVDTGRPIDHECAILPPAALRAEMASDYALAQQIIGDAKPLRVVRGRPLRSSPHAQVAASHARAVLAARHSTAAEKADARALLDGEEESK